MNGPRDHLPATKDRTRSNRLQSDEQDRKAVATACDLHLEDCCRHHDPLTSLRMQKVPATRGDFREAAK